MIICSYRRRVVPEPAAATSTGSPAAGFVIGTTTAWQQVAVH
ncbi:hypothetical protein [Nonomuraea sp. NPDC049028]